MIEFLTRIATETGVVFYEGSLYILIGFVVAGLLHEFLPSATIARHLGRESPRSVFLAALFGAPIPLCSCGVLPAAAELRNKGASRSATLSFLISTPETGVDSIALTYGLLGPVMAIVRPVVAVLTGTVAGLISIAIPVDEREEHDLATLDTECIDECGEHEHELPSPSGAPRTMASSTRSVLGYGFGTLLDEIAFWLAGGILLTGFLSALLPADFFSRVLGWESGIVPMLAMVVAGVPLYLCASASTPVAAALIAKGLSPGAALVFLLVGPATNAATMTVVARLLGGRRLRVYLGSIVLVSIAAGLAVDTFGSDAFRQTVLDGTASSDGPWLARIKLLAAAVFAVLLVASLRRTGLRAGWSEITSQLLKLGPALRELGRHRWLTPTSAALAAVALLVWLLSVCIVVVPPGSVGVLQRFGRIDEARAAPGLHFHLPPPFGRATTVDLGTVRSVNVGFRGSADGRRPAVSTEAFYLTADENIIDIRAVVEYRVVDPLRYAFKSAQADEAVGAAARRALVALVGGSNIDKLYTTERGAVEELLADTLALQVDAAALGCEIGAVRLLDVHAPAAVHDAFREVASAIEDRDRDIHDAAGYAAEAAALTTGDVAAVANAAKAATMKSVVEADARAGAFNALAAAHAGAPTVTETRLYIETMERALASPRKYIHAGDRLDVWIGDGLPQSMGADEAADDADAEPRSNDPFQQEDRAPTQP